MPCPGSYRGMELPQLPPPRLNQVIEALQRLDRRRVAALIAEELREGPPAGDHWRNVESVANRVGEIDCALEAARRYSLTEPRSMERVLHYCNSLAMRGRTDACAQLIEQVPQGLQAHPAVMHLRAALAKRKGDYATAAQLNRGLISQQPNEGEHWLNLAEVHRFNLGDADLARMESLIAEMRRGSAISRGAFFYALGKARHDTGNYDGAFAAYGEGAAQLRAPFDRAAQEGFVRDVIRDFTPELLSRLKPSGCDSDRAIFVTGLPRSGTTLVEQILASHSAVADGEEANLFCCALFPAGDFSWRGAWDYQQRTGSADPWGDVGRDYLAMLDQRFGRAGRIVDKTLNHSRFLGLILHSLPASHVIWLRRDPEDVAISCFRSYFGTGTIPWSWSLADIAWQFRLEDALHAHWSRVFPERILTVPYESLVREPRPWITTMLTHMGLPAEDACFAPHETRRDVQTASFAQVREPISPASIGGAARYHAHLQPFREAYSGTPAAG